MVAAMDMADMALAMAATVDTAGMGDIALASALLMLNPLLRLIPGMDMAATEAMAAMAAMVDMAAMAAMVEAMDTATMARDPQMLSPRLHPGMDTAEDTVAMADITADTGGVTVMVVDTDTTAERKFMLILLHQKEYS